MGELGDRLRAAVEPALEDGEVLRGVCVASQVGVFKGRQVAIASTDRRLIVQGMTRKFAPDGPPIALTAETIAEARADGAGDGWPTLGGLIMDGAAVTLRLRTTDGQKLKLMLMTGSGMLGTAGGGEDQRLGVESLVTWFAERA